MDASAHLNFVSLNAALKAAGEETRLRILALLAEAELTVSDLTQILRQSQPRISRHLKLLAEAGLVERFREGTWAFFRLADTGAGAELARAILAQLNLSDRVIKRDRERLASVRAARAAAAQKYFREHAADWDKIRKLHVADAAVEETIRAALAGPPFRALLDLGTGTGRMLEIFGPRVERAIGIDNSREMLAVARVNLERANLRNCAIRQGDIYQLPFADAGFDAAIFHQVLHYADRPGEAIAEAARMLRHDGRLAIVDFAPHALEFLRSEQAHRRLGFADTEITGWCREAGLVPEPVRHLVGHPLTVSIWVAQRRREDLQAAVTPPRATAS